MFDDMFKSQLGHCGIPVSPSLCEKWERGHQRNALVKAKTKSDAFLNAAREEIIPQQPLLQVIEPLSDKSLNLLIVIIPDTRTANICRCIAARV